MATVLIVDDEPGVRDFLAKVITRQGHTAVSAEDYGKALQAYEALETPLDVALVDLHLPDRSGLDLMLALRQRSPQASFVVITGDGGSDTAVRAMQLGANDFVEKPISVARIMAVLNNAVERATLGRRVSQLSSRPTDPFERIITRNAQMQELFRACALAAERPISILIEGESGTGKELLARAIHDASNRRGTFVAINCAAIPTELLESELFGVEKGAFTGAEQARLGLFREAAGGTLFLDEIGDMPIALQAKLLRVLEQGSVRPLGGAQDVEVDTRLIAASHRNLAQMIDQEQFRDDLYYRIAAFPVCIPPLRERREDIALLATHFRQTQPAPGDTGLTAGALTVLEHYDWPGNVRELASVIQRAEILSEDGTIDVAQLPAHLVDAVRAPLDADTPPIPTHETGDAFAWSSPDGIPTLAEIELRAIRAALAACDQNVSQAAKALGIGRATLYRKLDG